MALMGPSQHRRSDNHLFDALAITFNVVFVRLTTSMYLSGIRNAIACGTYNFLYFLEHDDAKCDSQKYSRCRVWLPSHPVLVVVLEDRESPFLCEVHCNALLHVRNLAEVGRMFGLHLLNFDGVDFVLLQFLNVCNEHDFLPNFSRHARCSA